MEYSHNLIHLIKLFNALDNTTNEDCRDFEDALSCASKCTSKMKSINREANNIPTENNLATAFTNLVLEVVRCNELKGYEKQEIMYHLKRIKAIVDKQ